MTLHTLFVNISEVTKLIQASLQIYVNWVVIGSGNRLTPIKLKVIAWINIEASNSIIMNKLRVNHSRHNTVFYTNTFETVACKILMTLFNITYIFAEWYLLIIGLVAGLAMYIFVVSQVSTAEFSIPSLSNRDSDWLTGEHWHSFRLIPPIIGVKSNITIVN